MRQAKVKRVLVTVCCAAALILSIFGCRKEQQQTALLDTWKSVADSAPGHSPTHKPNMVDVRKRVDQGLKPEEVKIEPEKPLPNMPVSLRMHKAPLPAVLQSLSRAGGVSLMLSPDMTGEVSVNIERQPWDQVFRGIVATNGLTFKWEGDILRVMTLKDVENDLQITEVKTKLAEQTIKKKEAEPLITRVIPIRYADAQNMQNIVRDIFLGLTSAGTPVAGGAAQSGQVSVAGKRISLDNTTNSLIIRTTREEMIAVYETIDRLDRPKKQINIKAWIVETNSDTARDLGIQWGGLFRQSPIDGNGNAMWVTPGGTRGTLSAPTTGFGASPGSYDYQYNPNLGTGVSPAGFGLNFLDNIFPATTYGALGSAINLMFGKLDGNLIELQLNALARENKVEILSSPSITTMDNIPAITENGENVPFVTTDDLGRRTVSFQDAVLRLEIRPHVIDSEYLKLYITVKNDQVDPNRANDVQGNPRIIKKQTLTTLITRDGETVVISGLSRGRTSGGESGLPGIKDIPLLGWVAKGERKSKADEEVLIFITPKVLAEWKPGEIQKSIEEIKQEQSKETE